MVFNIGYSMMHWSVPIFFMITGALLLKKERNITTKICMRCYVKRILLALFIFGVPFSWMEIFIDTQKISFQNIFLGFFLSILIGKSWGHLWYLYILIGIYLILPVIKAFTDKCSRAELRNVVVILFVFDIMIPFVEKAVNINVEFSIPITAYSMFYLLAGKYLNDETPKCLSSKLINAILLMFCMAAMVEINYFFYPKAIEYLGYSSPIVAGMCMLVFALAKEICVSDKYIDMLWAVDRLCFGAYLIHPVFTNFFYKFLKLTPLTFGALYPIGIFVFWCVFVLCGFLSSKIMSCIKPLKKYVL